MSVSNRESRPLSPCRPGAATYAGTASRRRRRPAQTPVAASPSPARTKGSNRRERTKKAIGRLAAREADRRAHGWKKPPPSWSSRFDFISLEDLRVQEHGPLSRRHHRQPGLQRRRQTRLEPERSSARRGRCSDVALTDKTAAAGVEFHAVNPAHTSQRCHVCGHSAAENRKSQAVFRCVRCGRRANADVNAASNILAAGRAVTGRGGTPTRSSTQRPRRNVNHQGRRVSDEPGNPTAFSRWRSQW